MSGGRQISSNRGFEIGELPYIRISCSPDVWCDYPLVPVSWQFCTHESRYRADLVWGERLGRKMWTRIFPKMMGFIVALGDYLNRKGRWRHRRGQRTCVRQEPQLSLVPRPTPLARLALRPPVSLAPQYLILIFRAARRYKFRTIQSNNNFSRS